MRHPLSDSKGFISARAAFWILFFLVSFYAAYIIAPPYVSFYMLRAAVGEETKVAHMYTDEKLSARIMAVAESWSVPLDPQEIYIDRNSETIDIFVRYENVFDFAGLYQKTVLFKINAIRNLKDSSTVLQ